MDKDTAIKTAIRNAKATGNNQGLWIAGPECYATTTYIEGDRHLKGFLAVVWPDGGIDYEAHKGRGDATA